MIRCVVFDFDGTLVLSNEIKRNSFFEVTSIFPGGKSCMEAILLDTSGDRYTVFNTFASQMSLSMFDLLNTYSHLCEEKILLCPERSGAESLLRALKEKRINIYVNSATPVDQLRKIITRRYEHKFFKGVFGGYGEKISNLRTILALEKISRDEMIMIGDGIDDFEAAKIIGCGFVGVGEGTLFRSNYDGQLVNSFSSILPQLLNGCKDD